MTAAAAPGGWLEGMSSDLRDLVATLHALHDRLAAAVVELCPDQLRTRSYATEWSVADVLSHLGSGASSPC